MTTLIIICIVLFFLSLIGMHLSNRVEPIGASIIYIFSLLMMFLSVFGTVIGMIIKVIML